MSVKIVCPLQRQVLREGNLRGANRGHGHETYQLTLHGLPLESVGASGADKSRS
jgi:hypothetical protein